MKKQAGMCMLVLSSCLLPCACGGSGSASSSQDWPQQFGSRSDDSAWSIAADGAGNIYVAGETFGRLDGNSSAGNYDLFVVKYDNRGRKQWARQFGSASKDRALDIAVDAGGNIYVTGETYGDLDGEGQGSHEGDSDLFVVKLDAAGTRQWVRQLGTITHDTAWGIAADAGGNIYVTGDTCGILEEGYDAGGQSVDLFVVKYDAGGNTTWIRQFGSLLSEFARGIAVDAAGGVYVAGYTYGAQGDTSNAGGADIFVTNYDQEGTRLWSRQFGTADHEYAYRIAVDEGDAGGSEALYLIGSTNRSLDGSTDPSDLLVLKCDAYGTELWTKRFGTAWSDYGNDITVDRFGGIYVTGTTSGALEGNVSSGRTDLLVVKYDAAGALLWSRQPGTALEDFGRGVAADGNGAVYVAGTTSGSLYANASSGGPDAFIIKYDAGGAAE